jgi:hypothetical protein
MPRYGGQVLPPPPGTPLSINVAAEAENGTA